MADFKKTLDQLKKTPAGLLVHEQLSHLLRQWNSSRQQLDSTHQTLISLLLGLYHRQPTAEEFAEVDKWLQRQRRDINAGEGLDDLLAELLKSHSPTNNGALPGGDSALTHDVEQQLASVALNATSTPSIGTHEKEGASTDPGASKSIRTPLQPPKISVSAREKAKASAPPAGPPESVPAPEPASTPEPASASGDQGTGSEPGEKQDEPRVERRVNSAYRLHLDRKREEILKLQKALHKKAQEAIAQNREFGVLLETELSALKQAKGVEEIEALKQILIGGTQELLGGQKELEEKLKGSLEYLALVRNDNEQLREELNKVRLLSLTDEFTHLPNRRAFRRRLEDEIGRAQRYETPLSVALIDLDEFKLVNDVHGHAAGDAMLKWYAERALTIFRHHDMVARYGGEEFAVLLPNTDQEGALCALNKVKNYVNNASLDYNGIMIPVPTFSTGLTLYQPGEPISDMVERADRALYRAKNLGRNRVEIAPLKKAISSEADHPV